MFTIPLEISTSINTLNAHGHSAFIVGGCVRDTLMGITPNDYDITTSATPQEIINIFEKTIPTGIKHGTVTVLINHKNIEITTFRTEGAYTDCRRPDKVEFVKSLKEDLSRRDFTINALAYNEKEGLIDYFCGQEDIKNKILRTVGAPEKRFKEDALRILRLFRFASTLNFTIEENTLNAALKCSNLLPFVSRERIALELKKAVLGNNTKAFKPLFETGALEFLKINKMPDFEKIHTLNKNLAFFEFLSGSKEALLELKPSNQEKQYFSDLNYLLSLDNPKTKLEIKEMLNKTSIEIVSDYLDYTNQNHTLLNEVLEQREPYKISDLKISGDDLLKLGFKGKEIKEKLEFLRRLVVETPSLNTKEKLLEKLNVTL